MKAIVVGYDGSEPSKRALERAADFAEAFGAKLTVITVTEPLPGAGDPLVPGDSMGIGVPSAPVLPDTAEADRDLKEARTSLSKRGVDAEYISTVAGATDAILDAAEERDADLVVVGSRHPGFIDRLLSGDVSAAVSRRSRRDVLIVH